MTDEPFEVWEHRIDELLDKKLKPIKDKLRKLDKELLRSQRSIAHFEVLSVANHCRGKFLNHKSKIPNIVFEQLTAKLTLALRELDKSADPISVIADFQEWCMDKQEELGITFIRLPA